MGAHFAELTIASAMAFSVPASESESCEMAYLPSGKAESSATKGCHVRHNSQNKVA
jgi:hypothetical protein